MTTYPPDYKRMDCTLGLRRDDGDGALSHIERINGLHPVGPAVIPGCIPVPEDAAPSRVVEIEEEMAPVPEDAELPSSGD
jgi:hypothetical protein